MNMSLCHSIIMQFLKRLSASSVALTTTHLSGQDDARVHRLVSRREHALHPCRVCQRLAPRPAGLLAQKEAHDVVRHSTGRSTSMNNRPTCAVPAHLGVHRPVAGLGVLGHPEVVQAQPRPGVRRHHGVADVCGHDIAKVGVGAGQPGVVGGPAEVHQAPVRGVQPHALEPNQVGGQPVRKLPGKAVVEDDRAQAQAPHAQVPVPQVGGAVAGGVPGLYRQGYF